MATLRNTKQRQQVLKAAQNRCDHPSADQIYLDVRKVDSKISRGTVYRSLNLLVENKELLHVKMPGVDRFDSRLDFHYHLLCTGCNSVFDAPLDYSHALDRELESFSSFAVIRHRTVFEGLCPVCQQNQAERRQPIGKT